MSRRAQPSRVVSEPATPAACAQDRANAQGPAAQTEQRGQTRSDGNASGSGWRGRRR